MAVSKQEVRIDVLNWTFGMAMERVKERDDVEVE